MTGKETLYNIFLEYFQTKLAESADAESEDIGLSPEKDMEAAKRTECWGSAPRHEMLLHPYPKPFLS
jgi:hypothetical protein